MAIPLVSSVFSATRSVLGDDRVAAGQVFTDSILQPKYQFAYSELFLALQNIQSQKLRRPAFYNVPANTGYLNPATAGIANMGELESIEERGGVTAWAISAVTPGSAICTLVNAASTLTTGQVAIVYGVSGITDDVNDQWVVQVGSSTQTILNGCTATGTYTSGGVLSYSSEQFAALTPKTRIDMIDSAPGNTFGEYALETGIIRLRPCSTVRQLKITYWLSGNAPTTTTASVGIDNSLVFLQYRTAGLAAESKGMLTRAKLYNDRAIGPKYDSEGIIGGILGQMLDAGVRDLQRLPSSERRSPPYGNRQNVWRTEQIL